MKSLALVVGAMAVAVASSLYAANQTLFDFQLIDVEGKAVNMSQFQGNVTLVINVVRFGEISED